MPTSVDQLNWVGRSLAGGRYRVTALLGEGGMGSVYRAQDRNLDAEVVIKVPKASLLADKEFAPRFAREVRALVRLAHAHIVRVLDVGEHERLPFAVMQFLPGGSLRDRALRASLSGPQAALGGLAAWLVGVADALDYVHGQGYVHRDVKPDNILFDQGGHAYLGDFGIAKALAAPGGIAVADATFQTTAGLIVGTPQYMAPELISGKGCDGRVDQYALAVTVYEVVCGRVPFDGSTPAALVVQHATRQPPPPHEVAVGVPLTFSAALLRGLSKDPSLRFPDCRTFAQALLAPLQAMGPASHVSGPFSRATPASVPKPLSSSGTAPVLPPGSSSVPSGSPSGVSRSAGPEYPCPSCGTVFRLPPQPEGKHLRCRHCGTEFQVPLNLSAPQAETDPAARRMPTPKATPAPVAAERPPTHRPAMVPPPPVNREDGHPCPSCGKMFAVPDRLWGKTVRCSRCQTKFTLPATVVPITQPIEPPSGSVPPPLPLTAPLSGAMTAPLQPPRLPAPVRSGRGFPWVKVILGSGAALVVLALLVTATVMFWPGAKTARKYKQGMTAIQLHDLDKAIACFQEAIDADPNNALAYCGLSEAHFRKAEYSQAIDAANEAVKRAPNLARAHAWRGGAYNRLGDYERAISDCHEAVRLDPKLALGWAFRGDAYGNQGDFEKAIDDCNKAIELDPGEALAYLARSDAYGDMGEIEKAIDDANRAVELAPNMGLAYAYRGARFGQQEKYGRALEDMDKALLLSPKEAETYNSRAIVYGHKGQNDLALNDYNKAIELSPRFAEFWANRSTCHLRLGNKDKALADVTEAIRLSPKSAPAHLHRGLYYMAQRDYSQAIADCTEAIRLNPRYAGAYYERAIARYFRGDIDQSVADLSEAINIRKKSPLYYVERGMIYLRRKNAHEQAIRDFEEASRLALAASMKHSASMATVYRAEALWRKQRLNEALEACNRALELNPQNAHAYGQRGWVRAMITLGTKKGPEMADGCNEAVRDCNTAIQLNPKVGIAYCARCYASLGLLAARGIQLQAPEAVRKLGEYMRDLNEAIKLDSTDAYAYLLRSVFNKLLGDQNQSRADYSRAVRLDPSLRDIKLP